MKTILEFLLPSRLRVFKQIFMTFGNLFRISIYMYLSFYHRVITDLFSCLKMAYKKKCVVDDGITLIFILSIIIKTAGYLKELLFTVTCFIQSTKWDMM